MTERRAKLVYSTATGSAADRAREPPATVADVAAEKQSVHVRIERAGRGGKTVTIAAPIYGKRESVERLLVELKRGCGSGGTVKTASDQAGRPCFVLELQGGHVARVVSALCASGYRAK